MINEELDRRYSWRIYPTEKQRTILKEQAGMCADLWNGLFSICEHRYSKSIQRSGKAISFHCGACATASEEKGKLVLCDKHRLPSYEGMTYWITELRQQCSEWQALSIGTPRRVAKSLDAAFKAFFRRVKSGDEAGYPRYKSRNRADAVPHMCASGCTIRKFHAHMDNSGRRHANLSEAAVSHRESLITIEKFLAHQDNSGSYHDTAQTKLLASRDNNWRVKKAQHPAHERSWLVQLKGVPGDIWARGMLPANINKFTEADVRLDRKEISFAVKMDARRKSTRARVIPITVKFDLLDCFAVVNGVPIMLDGLTEAERLDDERAVLQSEFDKKYARNSRPVGTKTGALTRPGTNQDDEQWRERCEARAAIGRLASRVARIRNNALHVWTKQLTERASVLTIHKPPVKENTRTPRGDAKEWGANVEIVSAINRRALSYAPGMAVMMLEYKAKELGIRCDVLANTPSMLVAGGELITAGKAVRKARREIRKTENVVSNI